MKIKIKGKEYELSTSLRVAYALQGCNNHKAYTEIFSEMGEMHIEEQISILYCAFRIANPTCEEITKQVFLDWFLDHSTITEIMQLIQQVVSGILGKDITEEDAPKQEIDKPAQPKTTPTV